MRMKHYHKLGLEFQWGRARTVRAFDLIPFGLSVLSTRLTRSFYLYLFPFCLSYYVELEDVQHGT